MKTSIDNFNITKNIKISLEIKKLRNKDFKTN